MNGIQPCAFAASPVSQNSLVLIQPATANSVPGAPPRPVLLLSQSVLSASSAKLRCCVPKQVSMVVNFCVFGSYTVTWREFWKKPSCGTSSGYICAECSGEPFLQ